MGSTSSYLFFKPAKTTSYFDRKMPKNDLGQPAKSVRLKPKIVE
jgi:hypothetical protein